MTEVNKQRYDSRCYELAEYFLSGEKMASAQDIDSLAATIQTAIEDWLYSANEHWLAAGR
jgi:hypothetical protein